MSNAGRSIAAVALAVAIAGCRDRAPTPAAKPLDCAAAFTTAAAPSPDDRVMTLIRGCPACGPSFAPLLAEADGKADLTALAAVIDACRPGCPKSALGKWRTVLADAEPGSPSNRGWRALAESCPAPVALPPELRYLASAPLFALTMIGRAVSTATPTVIVALPAWTASGNGVEVPTGHRSARLPFRAVTVFDRQLLVGRLPLGVLDATGWRIDTAAPGYPGAAATDLPAALAAIAAPTSVSALLTDDTLIIAPRAAPAARALAAIALVGRPARLAVAVPVETAAWRGVVAPQDLAWVPATGARVRVDVALGRVAAIGPDGAVRASFALPPGPDLAAQLGALWPAVPGATIEWVGAPPEAFDVTALIATVDRAIDAKVAAMAVGTGDAAASDRGAFDPAALTAALTSAPAP